MATESMVEALGTKAETLSVNPTWNGLWCYERNPPPAGTSSHHTVPENISPKSTGVHPYIANPLFNFQLKLDRFNTGAAGPTGQEEPVDMTCPQSQHPTPAASVLKEEEEGGGGEEKERGHYGKSCVISARAKARGYTWA